MWTAWWWCGNELTIYRSVAIHILRWIGKSTDAMDDKYLFKFCYSSSDNERLQVSQSCDRRYSIIIASKIHSDNLHSDFQTKLESDPTYKCKYHKSCVTKCLTKTTRLAEKQKRAASSSSHLHDKRTRSNAGPSFDWLRQCFYCRGPCSVDQDPKNPNWWTPSYLVRETKEKHNKKDWTEKADAIEKRIKDKCDERANDWADSVLGRLTCLIRWRASP